MGFFAFKQQTIRFLRWSERYTKTDMVYLTRGSFWMMARQVALSLVAFGMAIAFANLLPQETYGAYKYILSVAILLAITTLSGINTALTRSVAKGYEGSMLQSLSTRIRWGILGSIMALFVVLYYEIQGNRALSLAFLIVLLFLPLKSSFSVYQSYWQGKQRFDTFSKLGILQEVLATIPLLAALALTDNLTTVILVYFLAQTCASAVLFAYTLRHVVNQNRDPETIRLGKHFSFSGVLFTIANNCTDIILWHLLGPVPVAVYAFATRPPQELRRLFTESFPIALPKFSQRDVGEIKATLLKKIARLYVLLLPCVAVYILVAPFVYQWFFPAYLEAVRYSQVFSFSILFAPLSLFGMMFQAQGRTREIYILSILSPLLLIAALFIFVPIFGLMGAVIALLSELAVQAVVSLVLFKRL